MNVKYLPHQNLFHLDIYNLSYDVLLFVVSFVWYVYHILPKLSFTYGTDGCEIPMLKKIAEFYQL